MFEVDNQRVSHLAANLAAMRFAADFAEQITPTVRATKEARLRAILWAAAICHATHGGVKGRLRTGSYQGWDFLLRALLFAAERDEDSVAPFSIERITGSALHELLVAESAEYVITLRDFDRRAEILRACAAHLNGEYGGAVDALLSACTHQVGGSAGAYERLSQFESFHDPLLKKSSAFLMTVYFGKLWRIEDPENVMPMIDYHRMRVLCRTGCIKVTDADVGEKLRRRIAVAEDVECRLREVAVRVCKQMAATTGQPVFDLDLLLWLHARSCCRNRPMCISGSAEGPSFHSLVREMPVDRCVFQDWCPGACDAEMRSYWEPQLATELY